MKQRHWWKWYRRMRGGTWYLIHLAPDMPLVRLFCIWTQDSPSDFDGVEVIDVEKYPEKRK